MKNAPPSTLSLVLVPAILTLIVSVLRLVGQLNDWSPLWFGDGSGGGAIDGEEGGSGALLGISWLMFVFGLWFGFRLQRSSAAVQRGKTVLLAALPVALVIGGMVIAQALDLVFIPSPDEPGEPRGLGVFMGVLLVGMVLSFVAWPRLARTMLVYALLARIPVVVITLLAIQFDWQGTHYTAVAPGFPTPAPDERLAFLLTPQLTFWPMMTVMFGTLFGAIGAAIAGRPRAS